MFVLECENRRNLENTQLAVITGHFKTCSTALYCFYKNYRFEIRGMPKRAHGNILKSEYYDTVFGPSFAYF